MVGNGKNGDRGCDLQAIHHAAIVSLMAVEVLIPYCIDYRKKYYNETLADVYRAKKNYEVC